MELPKNDSELIALRSIFDQVDPVGIYFDDNIDEFSNSKNGMGAK